MAKVPLPVLTKDEHERVLKRARARLAEIKAAPPRRLPSSGRGGYWMRDNIWIRDEDSSHSTE